LLKLVGLPILTGPNYEGQILFQIRFPGNGKCRKWRQQASLDFDLTASWLGAVELNDLTECQLY
jgi:hypothetical protein